MSILDGIKRIFNISGAEIKVITENNVFFQSDLIVGEVIILSPEYELTGNSIKLELREFWIEHPIPGKGRLPIREYKTRSDIVLDQSFVFEPNTEHRYPFEIRLPMNCRLTASGGGWCLVITLDIPNAVDPSKSFDIPVQPAKEFIALITYFENIKNFYEDKLSRHWSQWSSKTNFRLQPSKSKSSDMDYISFELLQTKNGGVRGGIKINLEEKTISDYFKSFIGRNKIESKFELSATQLFLPDGSVNEKEILNAIVNINS